MSRIRTKQHENPFQLAQEIADTPPGYRGIKFSLRRGTMYTYGRLASATVFLPGMDRMLLDAHAPIHVCRWAAWGKLMSDRILRLALALYVRRELDRVGQNQSGMCWLKDAQQNVAETIFHESTRGKVVMDWIKSNMHKHEYQESDMSFSPRFWLELEHKVAGVLPLPAYWAEIDRRVTAKPKRNPPGRIRTKVGPKQALPPKKILDAMKAVADFYAEQYEPKKKEK